jgi:hypothetical protein
MTHCRPATRQRARQAARELRRLDCVAAVDVLEPDAGPADRWALDVVAWSADGTIPWRVLDVLGTHQCDARAAPQGDAVQIAALL